MINTAPPASNSVHGTEKLFWYDKINFSNHVCQCGAVVKELLTRAEKPGSTPVDAAFFLFLCTIFFFCLVSFFNTIFPFGLFSLFLLQTLLVMHLDQYIYFKLKSGGLFWKRDTKTLDLHTGQAYDQIKKHKLSRHVPPLKRVIFFQCQLTSWQKHTVHHKLY